MQCDDFADQCEAKAGAFRGAVGAGAESAGGMRRSPIHAACSGMLKWGARKVILSLRGAGNMRDEFDFRLSYWAGRFACLTAVKAMRLKGRVTMLFIAHQTPRGLQVDEVFSFGGVHQHTNKFEVVVEDMK